MESLFSPRLALPRTSVDTGRTRHSAIDMFEQFPERRRYIRSRADIEFQLARMTLALSRAPLMRQEATLSWFDEATAGLAARAAPEHRDYVEERAASIRDTFFPPGPPTARPTSLSPGRKHPPPPGLQ